MNTAPETAPGVAAPHRTGSPLTAHQQLAKWDRYVQCLVRRYARHRFCSSAEDLHSEIVLHVLRYFASHDPSKGSFSTWLNKVTRTVVSMLYDRHARVLPAISLSTPVASDDGSATLSTVVADRAGLEAVEVIAAKERDAAVRAAVAALPDAEREAVTARFWGDDVLPSRLRPALARGLERLRSVLDSPERDDDG